MLSTLSVLQPRPKRARTTWFPTSLFNSNLEIKMFRFNKINNSFKHLIKPNHLLTASWFPSHCITTPPSTKASSSSPSNPNQRRCSTSSPSRLLLRNPSSSSWRLLSNRSLRPRPSRCLGSRPLLRWSKLRTSLASRLSTGSLLLPLKLRPWFRLSHSRASSKFSLKTPVSSKLLAHSKSSWATWWGGKFSKMLSRLLRAWASSRSMQTWDTYWPTKASSCKVRLNKVKSRWTCWRSKDKDWRLLKLLTWSTSSRRILTGTKPSSTGFAADSDSLSPKSTNGTGTEGRKKNKKTSCSTPAVRAWSTSWTPKKPKAWAASHSPPPANSLPMSSTGKLFLRTNHAIRLPRRTELFESRFLLS